MIASTPWRLTVDGTVIAADDIVVCVLGPPNDDLTDQDRTNGEAILALPDLIEALTNTVRMLEAVRYSAGLGKHQLARLEIAKVALAKVRGQG